MNKKIFIWRFLIYFYKDTIMTSLGLTDSIFLYLDIKINSMYFAKKKKIHVKNKNPIHTTLSINY